MLDRNQEAVDGTLDARDLAALVLELEDGDGDDPALALGGTFVGAPGCDADADGVVATGDIARLVELILGTE